MIFQRMSRFRTTIIARTVKSKSKDLQASVLLPTSRMNLAYGRWTNTISIPKGRVPPVNANVRMKRKKCCLFHNAHVQLIFSREYGFKDVIRTYWHREFQLERFPVANTDDFIENSNPILIQTFTKRVHTDDYKMKPEVRDSIGLGDRTEDGVDILEDRKGWWYAHWCILSPWWFAVYNAKERKCLQVWKITEVHESSK